MSPRLDLVKEAQISQQGTFQSTTDPQTPCPSPQEALRQEPQGSPQPFQTPSSRPISELNIIVSVKIQCQGIGLSSKDSHRGPFSLSLFSCNQQVSYRHLAPLWGLSTALSSSNCRFYLPAAEAFERLVKWSFEK